MDTAVASLPEPVSSTHVQSIAETILRTAKEGERDPASLQRMALLELRIIPQLGGQDFWFQHKNDRSPMRCGLWTFEPLVGASDAEVIKKARRLAKLFPWRFGAKLAS